MQRGSHLPAKDDAVRSRPLGAVPALFHSPIPDIQWVVQSRRALYSASETGIDGVLHGYCYGRLTRKALVSKSWPFHSPKEKLS
jgi:hypothetical protein